MPSGPKKRKSKRKNKASVSPPHQGWLRSHMQMLKAPSFGNGTKGKGKHNSAEMEAEGNKDRKEGEKISFLFKGVEAAAAGEMDALESEGSSIRALSMIGFQSEPENSQNLDDLKMLELEKSKDSFKETEDLERAVSNGFPEHYVTSDSKFDRSGRLEEKAREDDDTEAVKVDNSSKEAKSLQGEAHVPVIDATETGEVVVVKADVNAVFEAKNSTLEKDEKLVVHTVVPDEVSQNDEKDAFTPKTEIPHPPMVVRRASVWNCCGLLEILTSFQH